MFVRMQLASYALARITVLQELRGRAAIKQSFAAAPGSRRCRIDCGINLLHETARGSSLKQRAEIINAKYSFDRRIAMFRLWSARLCYWRGLAMQVFQGDAWSGVLRFRLRRRRRATRKTPQSAKASLGVPQDTYGREEKTGRREGGE